VDYGGRCDRLWHYCERRYEYRRQSYRSGVLGGTVFGAAAISCDTLLTIARRLANAINGMFVGIWAAASISTPGQLIIAVLSPINGFSLDVSLSSDSTLTLSVTGILESAE